MISWIQDFTQKNHKLLFGALLIVIIIAFVFTIGNMPTLGTGSGQTVKQESFFGYDLNNRQLMNDLFSDAQLSSIVSGRPLRTQEDGQYAVASRIVSFYLADTMNIPEPNEAQTERFIRNLPAFSGQGGSFSQERYLEFLDQIKADDRFSEGQFVKTMMEDWRIEKVRDALEGPGYVLPYEVIQEVRMRRTKWSVDVATLDYTTFQPEIELSEEDIQEYYNNNQFRYEIPPRAKAAYVYIPSERFLDQVPETFDAAKLEAFYDKNRGLFPDSDNFEQAQDEVLQAYRLREARKIAITFASEQFVYELYDQRIEDGSETYATLLDSLKLEEVAIPPYTRDGVPQHEAVTQNLLAQAFEMTRYYSDPYPVKDGVAVLILKEMLPTQLQPLDKVREEVASDLRDVRRRDAFVARGEELRAQLQEQTTEPEKFPLVAAKLGLNVQPYEGFTLESPPEGLNQIVISALSKNEPEEVSNMNLRNDTGYFVYIVNKDVPEISSDDEQVEQFMNMMKMMASRQSESDVIGELIAIGSAQGK